METYSLRLAPAAILRLSSADDVYTADIDVFKAWDFLTEASKQPNLDAKFLKVQQFIAEAWGAPLTEDSLQKITRNLTYEFENAIRTIGPVIEANAKKKLQSIVCFPDSSPASQPTIPTGPTA